MDDKRIEGMKAELVEAGCVIHIGDGSYTSSSKVLFPDNSVISYQIPVFDRFTPRREVVSVIRIAYAHLQQQRELEALRKLRAATPSPISYNYSKRAHVCSYCLANRDDTPDLVIHETDCVWFNAVQFAGVPTRQDTILQNLLSDDFESRDYAICEIETDIDFGVVPYLQEAIEKETNNELRRDMQDILAEFNITANDEGDTDG